MPVPLEQWLRENHERFGRVSDREMAEVWLHRDPLRAVRVDRGALLSPADGIVLYSDVRAADDAVEVKGRHLPLTKLLERWWVPETPSLVIGIFMTFWDVHVNRAPAAGPLFYRELPPVRTANLPMLYAEQDLMRDELGRALDAAHKFEGYNARTVNRIVAGDREVLVVQIADSEVNVIAPFTARQGWIYRQGERFGLVRWGSQVVFIVPGVSLDEVGAESLVAAGVHVEGGDPVARWTA